MYCAMCHYTLDIVVELCACFDKYETKPETVTFLLTSLPFYLFLALFIHSFIHNSAVLSFRDSTLSIYLGSERDERLCPTHALKEGHYYSCPLVINMNTNYPKN